MRIVAITMHDRLVSYQQLCIPWKLGFRNVFRLRKGFGHFESFWQRLRACEAYFPRENEKLVTGLSLGLLDYNCLTPRLQCEVFESSRHVCMA